MAPSAVTALSAGHKYTAICAGAITFGVLSLSAGLTSWVFVPVVSVSVWSALEAMTMYTAFRNGWEVPALDTRDVDDEFWEDDEEPEEPEEPDPFTVMVREAGAALPEGMRVDWARLSKLIVEDGWVARRVKSSPAMVTPVADQDKVRDFLIGYGVLTSKKIPAPTDRGRDILRFALPHS